MSKEGRKGKGERACRLGKGGSIKSRGGRRAHRRER
jgi:hypothetical protein